MTYRERLHIPLWWGVIAVFFIVSIAIAVMAYLPLRMGIALTVLSALAVVLALAAYSTTKLSIEDGAFAAGRNRLDAAYIAGAEGFEGQAARDAVGVNADHRAFMFTRPYLNSVVRVDIDDPADPHPYWLVSTRRPHELADAIGALKQGS